MFVHVKFVPKKNLIGTVLISSSHSDATILQYRLHNLEFLLTEEEM